MSVPTQPPACVPADLDAVAGLACRSAPQPPSPVPPALAGRIATALRAGVDADALHAAALIDLAAMDALGNALDRSISYLEMVTRLESRAATAFGDLAAAYLASAARRERVGDVLLALDAASRAIELDSASQPASFNRALALDLLGLDGEATREWDRYLRGDSTTPWAAHALRRRARAVARRPGIAPGPDTPADSIVAWAMRAPFEARMFAWQRLLGEWGTAVIAGDSARAAVRLAACAAVASAFLSRHDDASLDSAVRDIHMARGPALRRLARAHARYAAGITRTWENDHRAADSAYRDVLADQTLPRTLRDWAAVAHANALTYQQRPDEAERIALNLLRRIDQRRHPSLAGRAYWLVGIIRLRRGENDTGLATARAAWRAFEWAGERDNMAAFDGVEGELAVRLGDELAGVAAYRRSLLTLREYPASVWRHNLLFLLAASASRAGLDRAAMAIEAEDAATVEAAGRPVSVAESRLARARTLWAAGQTTRAREAFTVADRSIAALAAADPRHQLRADLNFSLAAGPLRSDPERARALLDSVVDFFTPSRQANKLIPAFLTRAEIGLSQGRPDLAEADLMRAAAVFDAQRATLASLPQRAQLMSQARAVSDRLVTLRLSQGRAREALAALEQRRTAFSLTGLDHQAADLPRITNGRLVALDYVLIGDTVFAWLVDSAGLSASRTVIDSGAFPRTVERVRTALALGAPDEQLRPDLARLHSWLVKPFAGRLATGGLTIAVVGDREVGEVPFAALFDEKSDRYLIQDHAIRWSPTLREIGRVAGTRGVPDRVLLVGQPVVDWRAFPSLMPLAGAEAETRSVARVYPAPTVLTGAAADSAAVMQAMQRAELFHFAGHALLDDARPERSRLVVGPHGLDAAAIGQLDLQRLRLVVLSACETMHAPERRGSGFAGLAEAFLAAGAGGVIGSLWRVNDEQTAALMSALHTSYGRTGDAVAALREAQLAMLDSESPELRSPAAWAGFRYSGR